MRVAKYFIVLLTVMFIGPKTFYADEINIEKIVEKANLASYYAGDDGTADVKMLIKDSQGRERLREFRILRKNINKGKEQKFYVYFKKPADVEKMVFMVWKYIDKDDDRWLYLPALDLVRRIASGDKRSSFIGSHFVYEDVSGRSVNADKHELIAAEDGKYKIKCVPKETKDTEFSYYFVWINKDNFVPEKAEYYNDQNKMIRTIEALKISDIQGNPTVVKSIAKDLERGGQTVMEFENIKYNIGLEEKIFAERYLRKVPGKWIN